MLPIVSIPSGIEDQINDSGLKNIWAVNDADVLPYDADLPSFSTPTAYYHDTSSRTVVVDMLLEFWYHHQILDGRPNMVAPEELADAHSELIEFFYSTSKRVLAGVTLGLSCMFYCAETVFD